MKIPVNTLEQGIRMILAAKTRAGRPSRRSPATLQGSKLNVGVGRKRRRVYLGRQEGPKAPHLRATTYGLAGDMRVISGASRAAIAEEPLSGDWLAVLSVQRQLVSDRTQRGQNQPAFIP
jgi:hypothetical protein